MRPVHRRQPDLFEEPQDRRPTPPERRQAMIEILRALLTEAIVRNRYAGTTTRP